MSALSDIIRQKTQRSLAKTKPPPTYELPIEGPPDATLELPAGGGRVEHAITVPVMPGMDALAVSRASVSLRGVAVDAPWVTVGHESSEAAEIARPSPETGEAMLTEIRVEGLGAGSDLRLAGTMLSGDATPATRDVRFVLSVFSGGRWSAPAAATPAFGSPGGSALYPPMLAGATLALAGSGSSRTAVIAVDPPLRCSRVRVMLLKDADADVSPTTSTRVPWSASSVKARWRPTPTKAAVSLVDDATALEVGTLPALDGRVSIDLSGGLGAMLARRHAAAPLAAPEVKLRLDAASAGKVEVRATLAAWYRKELASEPAVSLRGSPGALRRISAPGVVPRACECSLHGQWGPARLCASADRDDPAARAGVALAGARRLARWVPLTAAEAARRLLRLGVYARAAEPSELMLAVYGGDPAVVGRMIGRPAAVPAEPARDPAWIRADLPGADAADRAGVWVVAWVSRGAVQVYGRAGACQISPDGGGTWSVAGNLPLVQVHYDAGDDPPAPLSLRAGAALVDADLRARGPLAPRGMRVELVSLLGADALRPAVDAAGVLTLTLSCDQDVDLTPADLALLYDPWRPGGD